MSFDFEILFLPIIKKKLLCRDKIFQNFQLGEVLLFPGAFHGK
jgi:hypothetical protein